MPLELSSKISDTVNSRKRYQNFVVKFHNQIKAILYVKRSYFQIDVKDRNLEHFLCNCLRLNTTGAHWWLINRKQAIIWPNIDHVLWRLTLKRKCCHFDKIFITSCTVSCQNDNFQCSQWWKCHQNEDISVSVYDQQYCLCVRLHSTILHKSANIE